MRWWILEDTNNPGRVTNWTWGKEVKKKEVSGMISTFLVCVNGWMAMLFHNVETPNEDWRCVDLSPGHAVQEGHLGC